MIRVSLHGKLCNWLFQYATARALALRHRTGLVLDTTKGRHSRKLLAHFPLVASYEPAWWMPRRLYRPSPTFEERPWGYKEAVLSLPDGSWLKGYFQSPRYFADAWPTLRAELMPRLDRVTGRDAATPRAIEEANRGAGAIAVHVRRGETLHLPLHLVCTADYYRRAISHLRSAMPDARFFVFSDGLDWCESALAGLDLTFVRTDARPRAIYDLWLMTRCRHHILSNSTYSWWGASLGASEGQRVVIPERWFNDDAMNREALRDTVPAWWERLAVS